MAISMSVWMLPRYEEIQTGLWCHKCLKPSGYALPCDMLWESGVSGNGLTLRKCYDCGVALSDEVAWFGTLLAGLSEDES
jgi:hypothetical protein